MRCSFKIYPYGAAILTFWTVASVIFNVCVALKGGAESLAFSLLMMDLWYLASFVRRKEKNNKRKKKKMKEEKKNNKNK